MESASRALFGEMVRCLAFGMAALLFAINGHAAEKRVALVIGNGAYPGAPLLNPANDAKDMAVELRKLGFTVIERINANQKEMHRSITKFGESLSKDSVALFYYAGHGMQVRGKNYLIPVDAEIATENAVRSESVDVDGLLDQLTVSDLNLVILDACRNNPFERKFRALGGAGLAQMDAPKGTLIAYATAPGKTASDGEGRNGLFTGELLRQMRVPGLTIEQVLKNVRREITKATRDNQTPWESSSLTGDFYFTNTVRNSAGAMAAQKKASASSDVASQALLPVAVASSAPAVVPDTPLSGAPPAAQVPIEVPPVDGLVWTWPTSAKMTRTFGDQDSKGLQFSGAAGSPILAAADGKVVYAGDGLRSYGQLIIIKHNASSMSAYAHQQKILVKEGQTVTSGQAIGEMGSSGADSVKLHFEIRQQGKPVDPLPYLQASSSTVVSVAKTAVSPPARALSAEERQRFILLD